MVVQKLQKSDLSDLDTKNRIIEASLHLFALKGFDGASIREIAKLANVNVASMNYHFQSKENLRQEVMTMVVTDFKEKIKFFSQSAKTTSEFAGKIFEVLSNDSAKCLNHFKMILEAEEHPCETEPFPMGFEEFSVFLEQELNKKVPMAERIWLVNVVFSYIIHSAVMSSTTVGKKAIEKFFPKKRDSIPHYISQLVETLIRDLNRQYK